MLKIATVCSGIGSPEIAVKKHPHEIVFACEYDKYARASYIAIHGEVPMFNDMTKESWKRTDIFQKEDKLYSDLFIGGIPCQAFSLAGKRLGELDPRGLLFFDFYRYVKNQQPKVFIIENVKGLISMDGGKVLQNWLLLLGNSVNGHSQMFNHPDSLGYNLHYTVLNSKNFGVPQNRERVFIVGIRSDLPNDFRFPSGWRLDKRLKDVLEDHIDEKYYLSDKMLSGFINKGNTGFINQDTQASQVHSINGLMPTLSAGTHGYANGYVKDPFFVAMRGRNPENSSDRTVGAPTEQRLEPNSQGITNTITSVQKDNLIVEPQILVKKRTEYGKEIRKEYEKGNIEATRNEISQLEPRNNGISNTISTVQKDNLLLEPQLTQVAQLDGFESEGRIYDINGLSRTIKNGGGGGAKTGWYQNESRIRRLTPLECWRLQGFPDEAFHKAKEVNSDTQLYKQAGNSMTTTVMEAIIDNLLPVLC